MTAFGWSSSSKWLRSLIYMMICVCLTIRVNQKQLVDQILSIFIATSTIQGHEEYQPAETSNCLVFMFELSLVLQFVIF